MASRRLSRLAAPGAGLLSAAAFWVGTGLAPRWPLTWLAPLPLLLVATRSSALATAVCSFLGYALGMMNTWTYLSVLPPAASVLLVVVPSLVFALCVSANRRLRLQAATWWSLVSAPAIWTAYIYLQYLWWPHGTFGALAYTQVNCLPILQMAAWGGIWPIEFLLLLLPSAAALLLAGEVARQRNRVLAVAMAAILVTVVSHGLVRLAGSTTDGVGMVGLVASDRPEDSWGKDPIPILGRYLAEVPALARAGAKLIAFPEGLLRMNLQTAEADARALDALLSKAATANRVGIVVGAARTDRSGREWNEARYYAPQGAPLLTYAKQHLLPPYEDHFTPGSTLTTFSQDSRQVGLAICKDLDFPSLGAAYGRRHVDYLVVPAFDFSLDAWLHSRMAVVRGVEAGFSMARVANRGALTVSDSRGRVVAEARSDAARFVTLVAAIPGGRAATLYARWGDWIAWLNLLLAAGVLAALARRGRARLTSARAASPVALARAQGKTERHREDSSASPATFHRG
jgi:apolipoprotein N-acyltransferase